MHLTDERNDGSYILKSKEIDFFSPLEEKILFLISKKHTYPKNIAKQLRINEQTVYYHIKRLQKLGIIRILRKEEHGAYLANIYELTSPSFFVKFSELQKSHKVPASDNEFLRPFIENGNFNAKIIVGSPDPHGPERARSRDAYYAIDLGLFLGKFLSYSSSAVNLDTDVRENDLKNNLIVIGGPVINRITKIINDKMPIRFDSKKNIYSLFTKKTYRSDDCGIIVKIQNPFDKTKSILLIAGKRHSGTKAAILSLINKFDEISKKNTRVVEGLDQNGDGIVDDVKILE
ncbi:MAG: S-layer protein [Candidatus Aenigmarchaeota archaeon]|nr:S-layer protein [Candidatus Aenigmarchaeota archaeon]